MSTSYTIRNLLSAEDLALISTCLDRGTWSKSVEEVMEYYPGYQTNSEMVPGEFRSVIEQTVMAKINSDQDFYDLVFPARSTSVIVSKTEIGEGLKIHHDNTSVGEFSTTVFLSDPATYEGGELCLHYEGKVQEFKLPAGQAITYATGAPHCVMPVKSGVRKVAVFWTSSKIRDFRHREVLSGMRRLRRGLLPTHTYDFDAAVNSPEFQLLELENMYTRYFL